MEREYSQCAVRGEVEAALLPVDLEGHCVPNASVGGTFARSPPAHAHVFAAGVDRIGSPGRFGPSVRRARRTPLRSRCLVTE